MKRAHHFIGFLLAIGSTFNLNSCAVGLGEPCNGSNRSRFLLEEFDPITIKEKLLFAGLTKDRYDTLSFNLIGIDTNVFLLNHDGDLHTSGFCKAYIEQLKMNYYSSEPDIKYQLIWNPPLEPHYSANIDLPPSGNTSAHISFVDWEQGDYERINYSWNQRSKTDKAWGPDTFIFQKDSGLIKIVLDTISYKLVK